VRYPSGKLKEDRVTIALGILASDAIILAADTQVGVTDYLKMDQGKISYAGVSRVGEKAEERFHAAVGITGSGNAQYLRHLQKDIVKVVSEPSKPPTLDEFWSLASDRVKTFHNDHVLPFSSYGSGAPTVSLLIGYSHKGALKLWSSENNLLTEANYFASVGAGAMYAQIVLSNLFIPMWPMDSLVASLLAAYVVHQVKKHIDGCGNDTDILSFGRDVTVQVPRERVRRLEVVFEDIYDIQSRIVHRIFRAEQSVVDEEISQAINVVVSRVHGIASSKQSD
jgi:hypothetical protein